LRPPRYDRLADYRVLVLDTHPLVPSSTTVRGAIERLAVQLDSAGAKVERNSTVLPDLVEDARIYMRLLLALTAASYPADLYSQMRAAARTVATTDASLASERTRGSVLSYRDWIATDALRTRKRAEWGRLFQEFDVVLCPVSPTPAFPHDHSPDQWSRSIVIDGVKHDYADQLVWAGIASASGLPATVAPIGRSDDGLPIGVQIIGPMFEDRTPIRFAQLIEEHFSAFNPPPLASPTARRRAGDGYGNARRARSTTGSS
jgi:amidase